MNSAFRNVIFALVLLYLSASVAAKCSFFQCNAVSKAAFAAAFSTAVAAPAVGCQTMTADQWNSVGCDNPSTDRFTKICAPARWSSVLRLFATAMALKTKILVRSPNTMTSLFGTPNGRALIRHELTHIRQQSSLSSYAFGYSYISEYCKAGCSYWDNIYEVEARRYQNDNC